MSRYFEKGTKEYNQLCGAVRECCQSFDLMTDTEAWAEQCSDVFARFIEGGGSEDAAAGVACGLLAMSAMVRAMHEIANQS